MFTFSFGKIPARQWEEHYITSVTEEQEHGSAAFIPGHFK